MGSALGKTRNAQDDSITKCPRSQAEANGHISRHLCHRGEVLDVAAVGNDSVLAAGGDSTAVVSNLVTRQETRSFASHQKAVLKVCYSEELRSGFSCSRDARVFMWPDKVSTNSSREFVGHSLAVSGLALNSYATILATGSRDNSVRIWDVHSGICIAQQAMSRNIVTHICWCHQKVNEFVQTSEDKIVKLWDSRIMKVVQQFPMQRHIQTHCDASSDGWSVLTSNSGSNANGSGCSILLWDRREGNIVSKFAGHKSAVNSAIFLEQDLTGCFASCASDSTVKVWDIQSGDGLASDYVDGARALTSMCIVGNKHLVCGSQRRGIDIFEVDRARDGKCSLKFTEHL